MAEQDNTVVEEEGEELKSNKGEALMAIMQALAPNERKFILKKLLGGAILPRTNNFNTEKYALQLKPDIDAILADPKRLTLYYAKADYPNWSVNTLRNYVTHAFRFIVDNYDTDDKRYSKLRDQVEVRAKPDGVRIVWVDDASLYVLSARRVPIEDVKPETPEALQWKRQMWEFMDVAQKVGDKLELTNIMVSKEDMQELKDLFAPEDHPFGLVKITNDSVTIRKVS